MGVPYGNLGDVTLRALDVLRAARVVACEDTRQTSKLFDLLGLDKRDVQFVRHDKEVERAGAAALVAKMVSGEDVVLVSDTGMPAVSDPGAALIAAARAAGVPVDVVGAGTAVTHAVVGSGFEGGYVFLGFIPRKGKEREAVLARVAREGLTCVLYESPNRVAVTVADFSKMCGSERPAYVARELTKMHEEWLGATLGEIMAALEGREVKGECVMIIGGEVEGDTGALDVSDDDIKLRLAAGEKVKAVADFVAMVSGISRREAYTRVEGLKGE